MQNNRARIQNTASMCFKLFSIQTLPFLLFIIVSNHKDSNLTLLSIYYALVLHNILYVHFLIPTPTPQSRWYLHFADNETRSQGSEVIYPKPYI